MSARCLVEHEYEHEHEGSMSGTTAGMTPWTQNYTPHGWPWWACALAAAIPVVVLFYLLAVRHVSAPKAAAGGAAASILTAVLFVGMPWEKALAAFGYGAAVGLLPIGWIVFNAIFLYQIAVDTGKFEVMKASIARLTPDRRLQVLLIAFAFGAIVEGAAGFGAPVAISTALLVGLGFRPFPAAVLCLIANTAPVAWGSVGTPLVVLAKVSGLPINDLSAMNARILPITSVIVPIWLVRTMVPWRETFEVLPAILVCGGAFAATQFLWGNFVDVGLVDIVAGAVCILTLGVFLAFWKPRRVWRFPGESDAGLALPAGQSRVQSDECKVPGSGLMPPAPETRNEKPETSRPLTLAESLRAWTPFLVLFVFVVAWGVMRKPMDAWTCPGAPGLRTVYEIPVPGLHQQVLRTPPVVAEPHAEEAAYRLNWLSATGTGVLIACLVTAFLLRHPPRALGLSFLATCRRMKVPILAIAPMLGLAYVTRYSGLDAILGLAFTRTGVFYPFFGTFLGWLGVALTGSDTSSNALFGSLQRITATQLQIDPVLMCAANSAGGVMGKMVDAQSIVVAATAADLVGQEGSILLKVLWHSMALAAVVGLIVMGYAYLAPELVPHGVQLLSE